ncbi:MAG: CvpA family protein [Desulfobulbaceae bacterium]|nr:CvpA family protein [Desulfobulbaceae bacterium]
MISLGDITSFDVIVVVLFLLFVLRGIWVGFMRQVAFFLALVFSYLAAGEYAGKILPYADKIIDSPKLIFFISFMGLFIAGIIVFILLGKVLNLVVQLTLAGWLDKLLGFFLGLAKAALVTSFLYMIMSSGPSSAQELVKKSVTSKYLAEGSAFVHKLINDPELRQKFAAKGPAIPPEDEPEPGTPEEDGQADEHQLKSLIDSHLFQENHE